MLKFVFSCITSVLIHSHDLSQRLEKENVINKSFGLTLTLF